MEFSIISPLLGKVEVLPINSNLIILVDVQRLHENNEFHVFLVGFLLCQTKSFYAAPQRFIKLFPNYSRDSSVKES